MAAYDYRCRECTQVFEVRRAITEPAGPVACPAGHPDVTRIWSALALAGRSAGGDAAPAVPTRRAGGCCGGGCCG